ncbi:hypothetical protein Btru_053950 [Bulinus truncatus]|nr:hypothetical protein Btru_053950 [Bulinus truncatus]
MPTEPLDGNNEYPLTRCHKQDRSCSNHDLLMDPAAMLDDSYGCSALYFPIVENCARWHSAESNGLTPCEPNRHVITNSERDCCMKNPPEKSAQPNNKAAQSEKHRNGDDSGSEDISTKINRPQNSATFSPPANNNLSWSAMHEHDIANDGPSGQVTIDPVHVTSPTVQLATDSGADNHSNGPPRFYSEQVRKFSGADYCLLEEQ